MHCRLALASPDLPPPRPLAPSLLEKHLRMYGEYRIRKLPGSYHSLTSFLTYILGFPFQFYHEL